MFAAPSNDWNIYPAVLAHFAKGGISGDRAGDAVPVARNPKAVTALCPRTVRPLHPVPARR